MKTKFVFSVLLVLGLFCTPLQAQEYGSESDAVALVQKAINYYQKNGKEKVIAAVNDNKGGFIEKDLYITIIDQEGRSLAHGNNRRIVGVDLSKIRDVDGKYFIRDRINSLKNKRSGWQTYKFHDPMKQHIETKKTYSEIKDGLIFSCGVYQSE